MLRKFEGDIGQLKDEHRELRGLFVGVLCRFDQVLMKAIADVEARTTAEHERVSELKVDVKAEAEILRHQQNEIEQRYVALAQHL